MDHLYVGDVDEVEAHESDPDKSEGRVDCVETVYHTLVDGIRRVVSRYTNGM